MYWLLIISEAPPGDEKAETDTKVWHSLPCNDSMETENLGLPKSLQVSDGTVNENLRKTRNSMTAQTIYPYGREVSTPVGKPRSIYSYHREGVLAMNGKLTAPHRRSYSINTCPGTVHHTIPFPLWYDESWLSIRGGASFIGHIRLMMHIQREPAVSHAEHKGRETVIKRIYVYSKLLVRSNLW